VTAAFGHGPGYIPLVSLPIQTERLFIRPYAPGDLDDVAVMLGDPRVFWWLPRPLDREGARGWLEEQIASGRRGDGRFAVVCRASGRVIGGAALTPRDMAWGREYEVGYHLAADEWGKGYATEAARAMVDEARARGLRRVVAFIYTGNDRSQAVARRLGMVRGPRIHWAGLPHDVWELEFDGRHEPA
jgi:RimJ/RimL family protein N-acetyltransferase